MSETELTPAELGETQGGSMPYSGPLHYFAPGQKRPHYKLKAAVDAQYYKAAQEMLDRKFF